MGRKLKLRPAHESEATDRAAQVLEIADGQTDPIRWTGPDADPSAPDWCCPACARVLLIAWPLRDGVLLVRCPACQALGALP